MFEYKIIRTSTFEELEPAINEATKDGWQLHGEVQAVHKDLEGVRMAMDHYYWIAVMYRMPIYNAGNQTMISYRKEDDGSDDSPGDA